MLKDTKFVKWTNLLLIYFPFLALLILLKPNSGFPGDINCWMEWSIHATSEGITNMYKSRTNYLPIYNYILYFFGKYQGSVDNIINNINTLKNITLIFEFASSLIIYKIVNDKFKNQYKAILYSLFYLLNIGVLYNSLIWGQVDGIMSFFVLCSIFFAYNKKLLWTLVFFILAINTKLQSIIFLPIIILLIFPIIIKKEHIKKTILSFSLAIFLQFLILLPFIIGGDLKVIWNIVVGSSKRYSVASMNAFNLWYILLKTNPIKTPDTTLFMGISYKTWGLFSFFTTSLFALWHFVKPTIQAISNKARTQLSEKKVLISCALIPLLFFFFNTQMHERYSQPALVFLAIYAFLYKKPLPYILGSIATFLNLEGVLRYFQTGNYHTLVFMPWFIGCIYLLTIVLLFLDLYDVKLVKSKKKKEVLLINDI